MAITTISVGRPSGGFVLTSLQIILSDLEMYTPGSAKLLTLFKFLTKIPKSYCIRMKRKSNQYLYHLLTLYISCHIISQFNFSYSGVKEFSFSQTKTTCNLIDVIVCS